MAESSRLVMPGVILAALLYDMEGKSGDVEGFLFGTTTHRVVRSLEDTQAATEEGKTQLAVQTIVCSGQSFSFYDKQGRLLLDRLDAIRANRPVHSLIGWFKFRRNTALRPSARELEVHSQLCELYQKELNKNRELKHFGFLMGLFTANKMSEIISYDYRFMQINSERRIRPVQLDVINLEHSPQQEYLSFAPTTDYSPDLSVALSPLRESVKLMDNFFDSSVRELKDIAKKVHESSADIRKLEKEIEELRQKQDGSSRPLALSSSFDGPTGAVEAEKKGGN